MKNTGKKNKNKKDVVVFREKNYVQANIRIPAWLDLKLKKIAIEKKWSMTKVINDILELCVGGQ